jgi:hypothetical protein
MRAIANPDRPTATITAGSSANRRGSRSRNARRGLTQTRAAGDEQLSAEGRSRRAAPAAVDRRPLRL